MSSPTLFIGSDVASAHIDVCVHGHSGVRRLANAQREIDRWLASVPPGSHLAMESTGRYHRLLAERAVAAGLRVYVLNPRDVRAYANGLGQRGKTDRLDAQVLARYVAREHSELRCWQPLSPPVQQLQQLLGRRAAVVNKQQALRMSLGDMPELASALKDAERALGTLLQRIDALLKQALQAVPDWQSAVASISSVPGLGPLNTAALLALFQRLHSSRADSAVALAGMDLRPRDSGNSTGLRRMTKRGSAELRRLLFNAARSAARTAAWRPYYERELGKGLSPTEAANALARRLLRTAFSLFKSGQTFDPSRLALRA